MAEQIIVIVDTGQPLTVVVCNDCRALVREGYDQSMHDFWHTQIYAAAHGIELDD